MRCHLHGSAYGEEMACHTVNIAHYLRLRWTQLKIFVSDALNIAHYVHVFNSINRD